MTKGKKCFHCGGKIENFITENKDGDDNEYCCNCLAKVQLIGEEEDE